MPSLNWLGKDAIIDHHRRVPLHLLAELPDLAIPGEVNVSGPVHTLIEGDNLLALKALLPRYRGLVDCVYIDPPYNTGNEGWVYNDNVNSPQMKAWLAKEVGRDDLSRHDKWLCMMYPRLVLLRELLAVHGSIWVHIDHGELARLVLMMDEIFGEDNRMNLVAWQKKYAAANDDSGIASVHEHVVCYRRSAAWSPRPLPRSDKNNTMYKYEDAGGVFRIDNYTCNKNASERPNLAYDIINPNTGVVAKANSSHVWRFNEAGHRRNENEDLVWWGPDGNAARPQFKRYLKNLRRGGAQVPSSWWPHEDAGHTDEARKELRAILGREVSSDFATPKPTRMAERVLTIATGPNAIILDAFAGSGTTGHAVMALNAADGGTRECLLIQLGQDQAAGPNIARAITRERLARVSQGYTTAKDEIVAGLSQAWRYQTIGESFLDDWGLPRHDLPFADLAPIVYQKSVDETWHGSVEKRAFLGVSSTGVGVYLLYNGDMEDKDVRSRNVLTQAMLDRLAPHAGPKIVWGAANRVDAQTLAAQRITFRQYPQGLIEVAS